MMLMRFSGLLFFLAFIWAAVKAATPDFTVKASVTPVVFRGDTLFYFHAGHKLVTADERAGLLEQRLERIAGLPDFSTDSLQIINDSALSEILYKGSLVMAVNDSDALYADVDRPQLAGEYRKILQDSLQRFEFRLNWHTLLNITWQALAVIVALILLIMAVNRLFRWLRYRLLTDKKFAELRVRNYSLLSKEQVFAVSKKILNIFRLFIIVLLLYIALPIFFSIFPWTRNIAGKLFGYILTPLKDIFWNIVHFVPNLLTILVIYFVTRYIVKAIGYFAGEVHRGALRIRNFYPDWAMPTFKIIKALLYVFMFIVIYPYLPGSESKVFQGVSVFLGILLSLGSTSAIANLVAGIVLTYMRPFKVGDRVKIGEVTGDVIEKTMLVTRIRTIKNEDITVPNSSVLSGHAINYSACAEKEGLLLHTTVTIGYDVPWKQVHALLIKAAQDTKGIMPHPDPFVLQTELNDFFVTYELNAYTHFPKQMAKLYSSLHQNIQNTFFEAGVEIMSPHYTALRDGNTVNIPEEFRPAGYKRQGFKIEEDKE